MGGAGIAHQPSAGVAVDFDLGSERYTFGLSSIIWLDGNQLSVPVMVGAVRGSTELTSMILEGRPRSPIRPRQAWKARYGTASGTTFRLSPLR